MRFVIPITFGLFFLVYGTIAVYCLVSGVSGLYRDWRADRSDSRRQPVSAEEQKKKDNEHWQGGWASKNRQKPE